MIVYQSTKQGFRDDVFSNEIDKKILEAYKIHLGRSTSANETLSWKNSMSYIRKSLILSPLRQFWLKEKSLCLKPN